MANPKPIHTMYSSILDVVYRGALDEYWSKIGRRDTLLSKETGFICNSSILKGALNFSLLRKENQPLCRNMMSLTVRQ